MGVVRLPEVDGITSVGVDGQYGGAQRIADLLSLCYLLLQARVLLRYTSR